MSGDIQRLADSFVVREFQFISKDPLQRINNLSNDIQNQYKTDGMLFLGAVQDAGLANNMQMLYFKQGQNKSKDQKYQLEPMILDQQTVSKIENLQAAFNANQISKDHVPRAIVSYAEMLSGQETVSHYIIYQKVESDKMFTVASFCDYLQEYTDQVKSKLLNKEQAKTVNVPHMKEILLTKMNDQLQTNDKAITNQVFSFLVNFCFNDSYFIATR